MDLNPPPPPSSSSSSGFSNFPILAIALVAIMVTGFLLVSYYIFVIKCCLNWPHVYSHGPRVAESWLAFSDINRGLDELVLRDIPTLKYRAKSRSSSFRSNKGERSFRGCAVCLSEFEDQEMLRVLPHCAHVFHLDCIDVWLMNNANCPLCRSTIVSAAKNHIVAPSSSPQPATTTSLDPQLNSEFVVIQNIDGESRRRNFHGSIMGDDQFDMNYPIRRSFSMDSATDQRLLLQVQQIIWQNRRSSNEAAASSSSSSNRSFRRTFFSFRQAQGSNTAILPIQSDCI